MAPRKKADITMSEDIPINEMSKPEPVEAEPAEPLSVKAGARMSDVVEQALPDEPKTPQDIATEMAKAGVSEAVIIAALNAQFGGGDVPGQAAPTPGSGELLGPDPHMVAAYKERMKTYKKPQKRWNFGALKADDETLRNRLADAVAQIDPEKMEAGEVVDFLARALDGLGGVSLPKKFNEWCVQWQYWQMTVRRMPAGTVFTESKVLEDMVRFHWFNHPQERAQLHMAQNPNQRTGPAAMFKANAGGWS